MIPGVSSRRRFSDLSEQEVLALAISSEEDDARIYLAYADGLREDYPQSAKIFEDMAAEEGEHRTRLIELHKKRFGDTIPLIRREHVRGYYDRKPDWLVRPLGLDKVRGQAAEMEAQAQRFYHRAAQQCTDADTRALLGDLALAESGHEQKAVQLEAEHLPEDARQEEDDAERKQFILTYVQPGLAGLMDGSVSTLAPIFAAAFATHDSWNAFVVGLAASIGAGLALVSVMAGLGLVPLWLALATVGAAALPALALQALMPGGPTLLKAETPHLTPAAVGRDEVSTRTATTLTEVQGHYLKASADGITELREIADFVLPYAQPVWRVLAQAKAKGQRILFEGAQGSLLDVDHGTYPYVTSSNTTAGGAATGTGVGPGRLDYVLGIVKAYATRVGSGPFPTEQDNDLGQQLRDKGAEYGTVTKRPRRCGWFDAVAARRSIFNNSVSGLCVTKLDVLDDLDEIHIGVGYRVDGRAVETPPIGADGFANIEAVYEVLPGWKCNTFGIQSFDALPENARRYLQRIEEVTGTPVAMVSTGPDRVHTIVLQNPFA